MEPAADGCRLPVGADSDSTNSHRHGRRYCSGCSHAFERTLTPAWLLRCDRARARLYDAQDSFLRASQSVLRIVGTHTALFFWRTRLGNAGATTCNFATNRERAVSLLGDKRLRNVLDCSFSTAACACRKSFRFTRQIRSCSG